MTNVKLSSEELEKVNNNVLRLGEDPTDVVLAKEISCAFYRVGNHIDCSYCRQPDDKVVECAEQYLASMAEELALVWSPEYDIPRQRETVTLDDVPIGQRCSSCYLAENCPMYRPKSMCGIDWAVADVDINNPDSLIGYLLDLQLRRINRAKTIELVDGGVPDMTLSGEMDRLTGLISMKENFGRSSFKVTVEGSSPGTPSILQSIFAGSLGKPVEPPALEQSKTIDITHTEQEKIHVKKRKKNE